ncbi:ubiquitin-like-conjugating enzyme ATG10 [Austrofundulus limnaeus]|uniref:Ubiquitin-like-conjugating enzyme ATG10 n=1 Tax=Austrofundulus limnaeus TaxID=52670 RepID=A0A2I4BNJ0_AUSLI|nr:PREDICTED: ubiquitin-like-conjugating enzyme ATG10 [Austrofundulus limnaeus]XP_013869294.1 PREDICTED: ubiquitin-like-conjugating enzyme ATG10 [Austrofundulus limnaeus]
MSWCVLDEEEFHRCCRLLLQQSERLRDGWSWEVVQGSEGYLKKTALRTAPAPERQEELGSHTWTPGLSSPQEEQPVCAASPDASSSSGEPEDEEDSSCCVSELSSSSSSSVLQFEYHVLYSCSYAAPVLYFRAFTLEGRSLTLEEAWRCVHPSFRLRLQSCPLNAISQQEHPLLGQPFFFLHPCRTEDFMRPVLRAAQDQHRPVNYVLSWLSVVGPVVGLDVSLQYCLEIQPETSLKLDLLC